MSPRICEFRGIVIGMYFDEHGVPHFHAAYGGEEASVAIETVTIIDGALPGRIQRVLREWADLHREELMTNWTRARNGKPLLPIDPLE